MNENLKRALNETMRSERRGAVKRIQHAIQQKANNCPPNKLNDPVGITWSELIRVFDDEWNR